ncbi:hypothetical protein Mapa_008719 [Marchantia paleacea]|nr:hypothetical protein Mapa_008719 [Marchantia paleacea]
MAGNADDELLAQLGVIAARPDEYERFVIEQAQELAGTSVVEENVDAALGFLKEEEDPKCRERRGRIQTILLQLENEITAVEDSRVAFASSSNSADEESQEKANGVGTSKGRKLQRKNVIAEDGGAAMHLAILDERLASLNAKRKNLRGQLKILENSNANRYVRKKRQQEEHSSATPSRASKKVAFLCDDDEFDAALDAENARSRKRGVVPKTPSKAKALAFTEDEDFDAALDAATGTGFVESEREKLIREGVITPFSRVEGFEKRVHVRSRNVAPADEDNDLVRRSIANTTASMAAHIKSRPATKLLDSSELPELELPTREFRLLRTPLRRVTADGSEKKPKAKVKSGVKRKRPQPDSKYRRRHEASSSDEDDSNPEANGVKSTKRSQRTRLRHANAGELLEEEGLDDEYEDDDECDVALDGGLKIPGVIYHKLFDYQKTGVKWMWELHCQKSGGIIGDEMGLGKTIQVTSFLAALHYSGLYRPSIIICPVTLLRQWKREVKKWYAPFKAEILHDSAVKGHFNQSKKKNGVREEGECDEENGSEIEDEQDEEEEEEKNSEDEEVQKGKKPKNRAERWNAMIERVTKSESGLLITTYEQLRINRERLLDINWGYAVLDEGHRIRNPDAEITLVCKQVQTIHRIIMTGAPIQNRLTELWSLFDFVFPGKLGVLPVFQAQFSLPIQIGGYANATPLQVSTAYKCAAVLRELILPYLLRRMKVDVKANLPKKTEHVLFCKLTQEQRSAYRAFLGSSEVEQIIEGNRNSLFGIDILRKICNHPDLLEREHSAGHPDYGNPERSGKMKLVGPILGLWKKQGHRVLLFTQTQQMLDIIESFAVAQGYEYRRMDGYTPVKQRMYLIDEFNDSEQVFLFIMTTKVGGLGTNLTGANRVIIFDPDWNPSTDMQARERAWRIGQKKDVTIYRLITQGTIEEKVYHRQIYKHFLTNKILKDPQQRRIFKSRDLQDLFTLQEEKCGTTSTETAALFGDSVENLLALTEAEAMKVNDETLIALCNPKGMNDVEGKEESSVLDCTSDRSKDNVEGEQEETQEEESRILKDLFEANGIHSAMDHDAILGVSETEKAKVDLEADRVAKRAADAIRQSRMIRASDDVAVPTWTGRHGEAGAPSNVRQKFGSTTNSRLVGRSTTVTASAQTGSIQNVRTDVSSNARFSAGVAAGSGVGRALTSSDVLNRMRERNMGAIGAGMESAGPSSKVSPSSLVANRFGRGSAPRVGLSFHPPPSGRVLTSPSLSQQNVQPSSGRGSALPNGAGPSVKASATQIGAGQGSPVRTLAGRNGQIPVGGSTIRTIARMTPGTQNSLLSSSGGREGANSSNPIPDSTPLPPESEQLLSQIKIYLEQNDGSVPSAVIANHFKDLIPSKDFSLFRRLLRVAATLEQGDDECSMWTLKPNLRSQPSRF